MIAITTGVYAQQNQIRPKHITTEDGLSQSTVYSICQDYFGFMWFGTYDGLNRYDGYQIINDFGNNTDSTSLSKNSIQVIFEDSKRRLWIGTEGGGLNQYFHESNTFKQYKYDYKNANSISSNEVYAIHEDHKGNIWIGTRFGLNKYLEDSDSFERYIHAQDTKLGLKRNIISCLGSDKENTLWIGTLGGGLDVLNTNTFRYKNYNSSQKNSINDNYVWAINLINNNELYIGTKDGAINVLNLITNTFKYYGYSEEELTNKGENFVRSIVAGENNDIWVSTDGGGLYQINHVTGYFNQNRHNPSLSNTLGSNNTTSIFRDKQNNLWVGLVDKGVDHFNLTHNGVFQLEHDPINTNSIPHSIINWIMESRDGDYWFATEHGLSHTTPDFKTFTNYSGNKTQNSINNNAVTTLFESSNGDIWIGTYLGGVNIFNRKNKTFKVLENNPNDNNSLSGNFVRAIYEAEDGIFWIGTIRNGLNKYDSKTGEFTRFYHQPNKPKSISSNYIMSIAKGNNDSILWIATFGDGLNKLNTNTNQFTVYKNEPHNASSISDNQVISLFTDTENNFWVGTTNGLNLFNTQTETFTCYNEQNGLPNGVINSIIQDHNGNIWVSTNHGLSKFNEKEKTFKSLFIKDGLSSNEFNYNAAHIDNKGKLYFGSINGVNYFNPNNIFNNTLNSKLRFTDFKIFNKSIKIGQIIDDNIILNQPIYNTDSIKLSHKAKAFTLYFSAFAYASPKAINYAYQIEHQHTDWIELGNQNFVSFHELSPGSHKLLVRATDYNGNWQAEHLSLSIIIQAHFSQTLWFKLLIVLIIIALILMYYYTRLNRIKQQNNLLEKTVKIKTLDLYEANTILEEKQAEMEMQNEEIVSQRDLVNEQNEKIIEQYKLLETYKEDLERTVDERTAALIKAKNKAEKADLLKTAFLANMSHEIRTPMNAILGFLEVLDEPGYTDEERVSFKKLIFNSGQSLLTLINDIIDIAKIESGELNIIKAPTDLQMLFEGLFKLFEQKAVDNHPDIRIILEKTEPYTINTDGIRLNQVLINLLDNALKFTEKGSVKFGYSIRQNAVFIWVKDTGIGISPQDITKIFERFHKKETDKNRVFRGTGLGLTISEHLIKRIDGTIWVESELGKGSTFYIKLPI